MPKMTILRGVSGSGKSTWARQQQDVYGTLVVSRDAIRKMIYGSDGPDYYDVRKEILTLREMKVTAVQDAMIAGLLKAGSDVIVDNTNIEWKYVKALAKLAVRNGAEVEVKVFDVPLQKAIDNDSYRANRGGRRVGDTIIRRQHMRFQGNKNKTLDSVVLPAPYHGTPGKPKAFIVDIDGTLAHMNNKRGPFDWAKVGVDDVDEVIADIVSLLWLGMDQTTTGSVIVMSGRDESCKTETENWLHKHGIPFDHLFMRPANDYRPDNEIKVELFDTYVRDNFDVQFVLDDRQQVVDMWRSMGITCLQVAPSFD